MSQPKGHVDADYLDSAARLMEQSKRRSFDLMHLQPGHKVLDLGCGPGIDTLALSHIVGPKGEVHGADYDATMVAEAQQRAAASGVSAWVSHRQADASALPWPDDFFDASRSERVFQHLLRPEQAFAEIVRVTRPGGRVVVLDSDWATFTIDSDEAEIERRLVRFHAEHVMNNPYSGRMLHRLFRSQRLQEIRVEVWPVFLTDYGLARKILRLDHMEREALAAGAIDDSEAKRWRASLARGDAQNGFFASTNIVTVGGRKE